MRPTPQPQPDAKKVIAMARSGATHAQMCTVMGFISPRSLMRWCRTIPGLEQSLARAYLETCFALKQTLIQKALQGDTACLIFCNKTMNHMTVTEQLELTGAGGSPLSFNLSFEDGGPGQGAPRRLSRPVPQEVELVDD